MSRGQPTGREVARRVLRRAEGGAYASLALGGELSRARLSPADRRLATEIVYGVLRHQRRIDRALDALVRRGLGEVAPGVRAALRAGAYQILFLDRVPDHAAVNDAVTAARKLGGPKLGGFANGVLRRLAREGEPPLPDATTDPRGYAQTACSLPDWIAARLEAAVGGGELAEAAAALAEPAPLVVRANLLRASAEEVRAALAGEGAQSVEPVALCPGALSVRGLGDPEASDSFARGLWTVQDTAAQLVAEMLAPAPGAGVLDACAGVGGKSTHLAQLLGGRGTIDAADVSDRKLDLLRAAAARLGVGDVIRPVVADVAAPGDRLAARYGALLLDAPCTGLGVMRRHPESKWRVAESEIADMAALQRALLDSLASRLSPGGVLVYSVCTFTDEEGPAQIDRLMRDHPDLSAEAPPSRPGGPDWSTLLGDDHSLRTWPHRHGADAFYAIRLRRRG